MKRWRTVLTIVSDRKVRRIYLPADKAGRVVRVQVYTAARRSQGPAVDR